MISVEAVRNNRIAEEENVLDSDSINDVRNGELLVDGASHKDLNYVNKQLLNGINCEGDASTCSNHNDFKAANKIKSSENK